MLEPFNLLSILATHQWNKQINLNFFFPSLYAIVEIYQKKQTIESNLLTLIKSINFVLVSPTKIIGAWTLQSSNLTLLGSLTVVKF